MSNASQIRGPYEEARGLYRLLPPWEKVVLMPDETGIEAIFHGLTPEGYPKFAAQAAPYVIPRKQALHETGHAYEALVLRKGLSLDKFRTEYWTFRQFPGTWRDASRESAASSGMAAWVISPQESVAEAFANGVAGTFVGEKTLDYGKTIDPIATRAFFKKYDSEAILSYSPLAASFTPSPNFWPGTNRPKYIVLHTTQSWGTSAIGWFQNPSSQVSAHYVVREDGTIVAMVHEENSAWHAGNVMRPSTPLYTGVNPNLESIGIEIVGFATTQITFEQVDAVARLIKDIRARRGDLPTVTHHELDTVNRFDPGDQNTALIESALQGEQDLTDEQVKEIIRYMFLNQEGYDLVENAALHKYDAKVKAYIDTAFTNLESRIVDRIVERLKNG